MLETQFLLVNAHFALNLLAALVSFAVAWLYFDAWLGRKDFREGSKCFGMFLLSLSFLVHSTAIEQSILEYPILGPETINLLTAVFRISGYLVLIFGQIADPLQPLPEYRLKKLKKTTTIALFSIGAISPIQLIPFIFPLLAIVAGFLYLRRATVGLEHHLKPISWSLFALGFSELIGLAALFRNTDNVTLANLVAPFGLLWLIEHAMLVLAMFILGKWIWGYLIKRLETQLFMIFTTSTLAIFLLTAIFFTSVSLANLRRGLLENLKINVDVLQYTIDSKKAETLSDAQMIAQNPEVLSAVIDKNRKALAEVTVSILLAKKQAFLVVVSETGEVLVRADDPEKVGGSLSDDPLIKKALVGEEATGVVTKEGVMAPEVSVRAVTPLRSDGENIGAVLVGTTIDNAFVDGLKAATALDASVYGDNVRSATTFIAPDGKSRWVGIKEETDKIKKQVLNEGEAYAGSVKILNIAYLAAFTPLKNVDNNPVGMLFVGRPEVTTIQAAGNLIEQTFLVTVILLIFSIFPAYFISKYLVDQIKA